MSEQPVSDAPVQPAEGISGYVMSEETFKRNQNNFTYHAPTPDQLPRFDQIREAGRQLALLLNTMCPASRELSMAISRLEEAIMWGNAAIARNEVHNVEPG